MVRNGRDPVKLRLQRLDAARVARLHVEVRLVEIADFLLVGALGKVARSRHFDDGFYVFLRLLAQFVERAVTRLVGRHFEFRQPLAVDVGKEVIARANVRVDIRQVDTGNRFRGRACDRCRFRRGLLPAPREQYQRRGACNGFSHNGSLCGWVRFGF